MMETMFYILLTISFVSFFLAFFREGAQAVFLHVFAIVFFFLTAVGSISIDVTTGSTITPYGGNAIIGLICIGMGLVSAGFMVSRLPDLIK